MRGPKDRSFDRINSRLSLASGEAPRELDLISLRTSLRFEGYLRRQAATVARRREFEDLGIPTAFPYEGVPGLSREVVQRLLEVRPETIGQVEGGQVDLGVPSRKELEIRLQPSEQIDVRNEASPPGAFRQPVLERAMPHVDAGD